MANISTWTDVDVFMQSAIGAAVAVSTLTNAAEGVIGTGSAHGISTGEFFLLKAQGMPEVDGRIFRAKAASGSTLTIEGENTTNYGTFTSGTIQKITYGTNLATLTDVNGSGGEFDNIDTTFLKDKSRSSIPGLSAATEYKFESAWDVSDPGLIAAKAASTQKAQRAFMIVFSNGQRVVFYGYIGAQLIPGGSKGNMVTTSISINAQGELTVYAT
jgi:hypothetical protein